MALVDPYSPCPCGSEKKFKWCCQKVEPFVDRAERLEDNDQREAAIAVLNEGLAKFPDNPLLLLRKSFLLLEHHQEGEAKQTLRALLRKQPEHLIAGTLLTRLLLESEGPEAGASQFQDMLSHAQAGPDGVRRGLARLAVIVANAMGRESAFPAALKHYELASRLDHEEARKFASTLTSLKAEAPFPAWVKTPFRLSPPPDGLAEAEQERFQQAIAWADEGLWQFAASAFELLSADPVAGPRAERNLGLCRLWMADHEGAVEALRRWIASTEATTDAVDIECLCQYIDESEGEEPVELVQLSWPLRNRDALLQTLRDNNEVVEGNERKLNPIDIDSEEVPSFHLLDRRRIEAKTGLSRTEIPLVLGDVLVASEIVILEVYDDGRLNAVMDKFTALAGAAIPPAHPRTKVIEQTDRAELALSWNWYLPPDLPVKERKRLTREQITYIMTEVWPQTPAVYLGGKTPIQAAKAGSHPIALRAAVLFMELSGESWTKNVDWNQFKERLKVPPEPAIDPETIVIDAIPPARLRAIPPQQLNDAKLVELYHHARTWGMPDVVVNAARAIVERPGLLAQSQLPETLVYSDLALDAAGWGDRSLAEEWLRRGRSSEPAARRPVTAPVWDMFELQIKILLDDPESWVPDLAVILDRYRGNRTASLTIMTRLVEFGLIRMIPDPDHPGEVQLDTRLLQHYLSEYGPKVTTSGGYLGVSATRGEIWTPDSAAGGGGGGIWTPGSDVGSSPAASGEKPRIILPGS